MKFFPPLDNPTLQQLIREQEKFARAIEAVIGPSAYTIRETAAAVGGLNLERKETVRHFLERSTSSAGRDIAILQESWTRRLPEYPLEDFRMARQAELEALQSVHREYLKRTGIAEIAGHMEKVQAALRASSPLVSVDEVTNSLTGIAGLSALGGLLSAGDLFADSAANAIRSLLGDWRSVPGIPEITRGDPLARVGYYTSLGLDPALTAFPSDSFQESLRSTDVWPSPPHRDVTTPEVREAAEDYGIAVPDDVPEENREAYRELYRFERSMRRFLAAKMEKAYGPSWIKERVPEDIRKRWEARRQEALRQGGPGRPLLEYADLTDYLPIIVRGDNWSLFESLYRRKSSVEESFYRVYPGRLDVMHARPLLNEDLLFLSVEIRRLSKVIEEDEEGP